MNLDNIRNKPHAASPIRARLKRPFGRLRLHADVEKVVPRACKIQMEKAVCKCFLIDSIVYEARAPILYNPWLG